MRAALGVLVLAVAACSARREPAADTTALDSATAPAAAADSQSQPPDPQPAVTSGTSARSGGATKAGTSGTKGSSKTAINADTGMHPADTFGIHPRDSTLADFLKKRPPETRRPQDPQKTPR